MARIFLSAIALVIANLIVGSISVSLGLILAVVLIVMVAVTLGLFAALGLSTTLEKVGWLTPGWTDTKILGLRRWAKEKWHNLPTWYLEQKRRMIELLIETLKGKEEAADGIRIWKSVVAGLIFLLAIVLVRQNLNLSVGWSIAVVAVGSVFVAIPVLYFKGTGRPADDLRGPSGAFPANLFLTDEVTADPEEVKVALAELIRLRRTGRLKHLLDSPVLGDRDGKIEPTKETGQKTQDLM